MPSFNTDIYTAQIAAGGTSAATGGTNGNFNDRVDDSRRTEASLEYADFIYTISAGATEVANDTINLGFLPIGAIVYPEHSFLFNETDPGTTLTLDIGDSADVDRYADGIAGAAAGRVEFTSAVANVAGVVTRHEVTSTTRLLIATISAAVSSLTAGTKMHFKVAYKVLQP
jgi:hypothetical protein